MDNLKVAGSHVSVSMLLNITDNVGGNRSLKSAYKSSVAYREDKIKEGFQSTLLGR